jgi:hypothetical protein
MRKIIIFLALISLIFLASITGCFKEIPMSEVLACERDSDCVLVYSTGCCKCQMAINRDYQEYWERLEQRENQEECEGIKCEPCGPSKAIGKQCVNNACTVVFSPIGQAVQQVGG